MPIVTPLAALDNWRWRGGKFEFHYPLPMKPRPRRGSKAKSKTKRKNKGTTSTAGDQGALVQESCRYRAERVETGESYYLEALIGDLV